MKNTSVNLYSTLPTVRSLLQREVHWDFAPLFLILPGDNVICGSYDCRLAWFDLDLSTKPYKMLR